MKKLMQNRSFWLSFALGCLIAFGALPIAGCAAGGTKTTTIRTESTTPGRAGDESSTTVTTREEEDVTGARPRGVIGGILYTVGQVLIFPFKVIGSLF